MGRYGVDSIRLTGGEPMVRAGLPILVAKLADLGADLALTTNGATLRAHAAQLADAGLRRINISLDTLRRDRFVELTRRDELHRVLDGIDAALEAGLDPVKINVVLMRGINDDEVVDLARWGRDLGVHVRFIEFMPLDGDDRWSREIVVPQAEIIQRIDEVLPLEPIVRGHEPAERFRYLDGGGDVGVIASITQPFCDTCDRCPAHRRRPAARLPVRRRGDRPAGPAARRRQRRRGRGGDRAHRGREVGRAHDPAGRLHPTVALDERDRRLIAAVRRWSRLEPTGTGQDCRPCARSAARPVALGCSSPT